MNRFLGFALLLLGMAGCSCTPARPRGDPAIASLGAELTRLSTQIRQVQDQVRSILKEMIENIERDQLDIPSETTKVHQTINEVRRLREKLKTQRGQPLS